MARAWVVAWMHKSLERILRSVAVAGSDQENEVFGQEKMRGRAA